MHPSVMEWTGEMVTRYDLRHRTVLEAGSLDVNGSVRSLFAGPYHGIDMRAGPGVDEVADAHQLPDGYRSRFEVAVCTEMLEHDSAPWLSLRALRTAVKPGGVLLLTCRGYDERGCFPVHDFPEDLWRFSTGGIRHLLAQTGWEAEELQADPECPGVFALARKP